MKPYAPLNRRLSSAFYEFCLLFAVVFIAGWLFSTLTQTKDPFNQGRVWQIQAFLGLILAIYFSYFWSHGRRSLPQKTWGIRLQTTTGLPLSTVRALLRYLLVLSIMLGLFGLCHQVLKLNVLLASAAMLLPYFFAYTNADRQFLHDVLLRTRLVFDDSGK